MAGSESDKSSCDCQPPFAGQYLRRDIPREWWTSSAVGGCRFLFQSPALVQLNWWTWGLVLYFLSLTASSPEPPAAYSGCTLTTPYKRSSPSLIAAIIHRKLIWPPGAATFG